MDDCVLCGLNEIKRKLTNVQVAVAEVAAEQAPLCLVYFTSTAAATRASARKAGPCVPGASRQPRHRRAARVDGWLLRPRDFELQGSEARLAAKRG